MKIYYVRVCGYEIKNCNKLLMQFVTVLSNKLFFCVWTEKINTCNKKNYN